VPNIPFGRGKQSWHDSKIADHIRRISRDSGDQPLSR
jgi:hypothetical protein